MMFDLTKKTDYGIELMVALAKSYGKGPVSLRQVVKTRHLPLKFLENIATILREENLIDAKEGKAGGYALKKAPAKISLTKIVDALQGPMEMGGCFACPKANGCGQKDVWHEVGQSVKKTIGKKTLEDLL
ncbi:hypothetical protein COT65_00560 [Candidatus Shapirobacteria bacterium CG09_land_8_20_14_0_10_47_13]|uniref:Rrf2 family transcriptional regulator n=1 Tax=Candidatus Shapirobacteria bacterium CG09_land_8_20_14_0_10_47_13 TaxID=1974481 RepID=A0A2H0WNA6_9BACT|nr:MAG: hypothetical protein COT65_00560 [Candidatus Shapirobacteria bacterium CG09_land_8_20_14_0_10_47_13]